MKALFTAIALTIAAPAVAAEAPAKPDCCAKMKAEGKECCCKDMKSGEGAMAGHDAHAKMAPAPK